MFQELSDAATVGEVLGIVEGAELHLRVQLANDLHDSASISFVVRQTRLLAATNPSIAKINHQLAVSYPERGHAYWRCKLALAAFAMSSSIRSQTNRIFRPPNGRR